VSFTSDGKVCRVVYKSGPYNCINDIYDYLKQLYNSQQVRVEVQIEQIIHEPILDEIDGFSLVFKRYVFSDEEVTHQDMPSTMHRLGDETFNDFRIETWQTSTPMSLDAVLFLYDRIIGKKKHSLDPAFYHNGILMRDSATIFKEYKKKREMLKDNYTPFNFSTFYDTDEVMTI